MHSGEEKSRLLGACRAYIDAHPEGELDPKKLAEQFSLPYSSFRRLFEQSFGYSVYQYIRLRRVQRAAQTLREGGSLETAMKRGGFQTLSGFSKAFHAVYGVSYAAFAESKGRVLMPEPSLTEHPGFYLAGQVYPCPAEEAPEWEQKLPEAAEPVLSRQLEAGETLCGTRIQWDRSRQYYLLGETVRDPDFLPEGLAGYMLPGGRFLQFRLPAFGDRFRFEDARRAAWFYALEQYLPASPYVRDPLRVPFEQFRRGEGELFLPVLEDSAPPEED